jgi:hypothetical protein
VVCLSFVISSWFRFADYFVMRDTGAALGQGWGTLAGFSGHTGWPSRLDSTSAARGMAFRARVEVAATAGLLERFTCDFTCDAQDSIARNARSVPGR